MTASSQLRGRNDELRRLRDLCDRAVDDGQGGVVLVRGPAGIGKSRLLAAAGTVATELGMTVAAGGADEITTATPLAPLFTALQGAQPPILPPDVMTELSAVDDVRLVLVERVATALEHATRDRPALVVLDDLQWADPATFVMLSHLPRRLATSAVAWVLARRDHPAPAAAETLDERLLRDGAETVVLRPLPDDAIAAIAGDRLRARLDDDLLALLAQTRGNPFLGVELVDALLADGSLTVGDGMTRLLRTELPVQFRGMVRHKLRALSPAARDLVHVGAVLGRSFEVSDAVALLGWPVGTQLAAVDEVLRAGVVADADRALAFRHDLLRQAVYDDLPRSVRTSLHRQAATSLSAAGRELSAVIPHLLLGARTGDIVAAEQLAAGAAELSKVSPRQAAELMTRAVELLARDDSRRLPLAVQAVALLAYGDRLADAEDLAASLLDPPPGAPGTPRTTPVQAAQIHLALGYARYLAGDFSGSLETLGTALALPGLPPALRAPLLATHINVATALAPAGPEVHAHGAELEALAAAASDPTSVVLSRAALAQSAITDGRVDDMVRHLAKAAPLWDLLDPVFRGNRILHVMALAFADRFGDAAAELRRGVDEADRYGLAFTLPIWHQMRAHWLIRAGALDEARAEAETSLRLCDELDSHAGDIDAHGLLALIALAEDREADAHRHADQIMRVFTRRVGGDWSRTGAGPAGLALADLGRSADALAILAPAFDSLHGLVRAFNMTAPCMTVPLARFALGVGDVTRARRVLAIAEQLGVANPSAASARAAADHVRALLGDDPEGLTRAVAATAAVEQLRPMHAWALHDLGSLLARHAGSRDRAVEALEQAWQAYGALGWIRDQRRVQHELRRLGVRHRGWAPRPATPQSGWIALTPAEQRVAELAALGYTNRAIAASLFLSPHTVNTHLGRVFTKLGVRSRVQLARSAAER